LYSPTVAPLAASVESYLFVCRVQETSSSALCVLQLRTAREMLNVSMCARGLVWQWWVSVGLRAKHVRHGQPTRASWCGKDAGGATTENHSKAIAASKARCL
jgi:hypothetical protein